MFEVWILISSGSDIIIQIRTRGFGVILLANNWARRTQSRPTGTIYRSWDAFTIATVLSLLQDFMHICLAAETS